jgi:hypothetical protein
MAKPRKTKPKPTRKPAPKPAKRTEAPKRKRAAAIRARAAERSTESDAVLLGEITVPSGKLVIFDIGLFGYLPRDTLAPLLIRADVPRDRPLRVLGTRVGKGRFADCWDHVAIELAPGEPAHAKKLGSAAVDFARLACMDETVLDHWVHDESLDGLADFVFWGKDQLALARALGATRLAEGYGWANLTLADAEAKADRAARIKAENHWALATDLRPHSHHFQVLAAARANPAGAGVIEVGGCRALVFFTSWGDGVFPVCVDSDHDDRPVRIRIQLATAESNDAMRDVNRPRR